MDMLSKHEPGHTFGWFELWVSDGDTVDTIVEVPKQNLLYTTTNSNACIRTIERENTHRLQNSQLNMATAVVAAATSPSISLPLHSNPTCVLSAYACSSQQL